MKSPERGLTGPAAVMAASDSGTELIGKHETRRSKAVRAEADQILGEALPTFHAMAYACGQGSFPPFTSSLITPPEISGPWLARCEFAALGRRERSASTGRA